MNNKEILKNVLVTVGLLTISIVALVYFNTKLTDNSSKPGVAIAPAATIHQYVPTSSYAVTNAGASQEDMVASSAAVASNTPAAVKAFNYPNNLVIHASTNANNTVVGSTNTNNSIAPKSNIVQQRQQMQMGALTAVNSRRLTSETSTPATKNTQVGEPFQESTEVPGTISRKDLPEDPEEPFPDEEAPLGSGLVVLGVCALGYTLKQKISKAN
ncbi:MAG TPA: hypothetical protein P5564_04400 [Paludibacteraceae bacterium]|nr:hypothetical protein [Paludibacteraceae bacterium]